MLRLLKFIFTGDWHLHKWVLEQKVSVYGDGFGRSSKRPSAFERICVCETCGKYKTFSNL